MSFLCNLKQAPPKPDGQAVLHDHEGNAEAAEHPNGGEDAAEQAAGDDAGGEEEHGAMPNAE